MIKEGLRPRSNSEEEAFATMDNPNLNPFQREQMKMAFRNNLRSARKVEKKHRHSISSPPTCIKGRGSQYKSRGGSSSQPNLRQGSSIKDPIDIEREHDGNFRGVLLHGMT